MKIVANVFLAIVFVISIGIMIRGCESANADKVEEMVKQAEGDSLATEMLREFLIKHPEPSNNDVELLAKNLNELKLQKITEKTTGISVQEIKKAEESSKSPQERKLEELTGILLQVALALLALGILMRTIMSWRRYP